MYRKMCSYLIYHNDIVLCFSLLEFLSFLSLLGNIWFEKWSLSFWIHVSFTFEAQILISKTLSSIYFWSTYFDFENTEFLYSAYVEKITLS